MDKIDISEVLPKTLQDFVDLLPVNIKKKYMEDIFNGYKRNNLNLISKSIQESIYEVSKLMISKEDISLLQKSLDQSIINLNLTLKDPIIRRREPTENIVKDNLVGKEVLIEDEIYIPDIKRFVKEPIPELKEQKEIKKNKFNFDKGKNHSSLDALFGKKSEKKDIDDSKEVKIGHNDIFKDRN